MSALAVTLGLIFLIAFYYFITKDLIEKPKSAIDQIIAKRLRIKDILVFFHLLGLFLLVGFMWFLVILSAGETYETLLTTFATVVNWLVIALFLGYTSVYIIFRVEEEFTVYKHNKNKGNK